MRKERPWQPPKTDADKNRARAIETLVSAGRYICKSRGISPQLSIHQLRHIENVDDRQTLARIILCVFQVTGASGAWISAVKSLL